MGKQEGKESRARRIVTYCRGERQAQHRRLSPQQPYSEGRRRQPHRGAVDSKSTARQGAAEKDLTQRQGDGHRARYRGKTACDPSVR